jgi:hypothetical protein
MRMQLERAGNNGRRPGVLYLDSSQQQLCRVEPEIVTPLTQHHPQRTPVHHSTRVTGIENMHANRLAAKCVENALVLPMPLQYAWKKRFVL